MSYLAHGMVDVWYGGGPILPMVQWMSGVVDVCLVYVVQLSFMLALCIGYTQ